MNAGTGAFGKTPNQGLSNFWRTVSFLVTIGKSSVGGAGLSLALTGLMNAIFGFWIGSHLSNLAHLGTLELIATIGAIIGALIGGVASFRNFK